MCIGRYRCFLQTLHPSGTPTRCAPHLDLPQACPVWPAVSSTRGLCSASRGWISPFSRTRLEELLQCQGIFSKPWEVSVALQRCDCSQREV